MLCQDDTLWVKIIKWLVDFIVKGIVIVVVLATLAWIGAMLVKHGWGPVRELWWKHWPVLPWIFEHGWWLIGVVTACILAWQFFRWQWIIRFYRWVSAKLKGSKRKKEVTSAHIYEVDDASGDRCGDELSRTDFIAYLENLLEGIEDGTTTYIGLYGEWGSGKSWILNGLIKDSDEKQKLIDFVVFNPWQVSKGRELGNALIDAIASKVQLRNWSLGALIRQYGQKLGITPHKGCFAGITGIGKWLDNSYDMLCDTGTIKNEIAERLHGYGRRIVVAIEDMDRLDYSEVREVIRIIRANGDIPNVTYILLADEEYLAKALGAAIGGDAVGRSYLQKIVDFPCHLPSVSSEELFAIYKRRVADYMKRAWGCEDTKESFERIAWLKEMFFTMRDVKRCSNAFIANMTRQKVKSKNWVPSIDWADMAGLSAIEVLETGLFKVLRSIYWTLHNIKDVDKAVKNYGEEWMSKTAWSLVNPRRIDAVRKFLESNMGISVQKEYGSGALYYRIDTSMSSVALANHWLMSPNCIDDYFSGKDCETCISKVDQNEFFSYVTTKPELAFNVAQRLANEGKLPYLVKIIGSYRHPTEGEGLVNYVATLMRMADAAWPRWQWRPPEFFANHINEDIYGSLATAADGALGYKDLRSEEFLIALAKTKSFAIGLTLMTKYWCDGIGYKFDIKEEKAEKLKKSIDMILTCAMEALENGKLQVHPKCDDFAKEICRLITQCDDDAVVAKFRNSYMQLSAIHNKVPIWFVEACSRYIGRNEATGAYRYGIDYDKFLNLAGRELATIIFEQLERLCNASEGGLGIENQAMFDQLKDLSARKDKGLPYGIYDQKAEFLS